MPSTGEASAAAHNDTTVGAADEAEAMRVEALWYDGRGDLFFAGPGRLALRRADSRVIEWPSPLGHVVGGDGWRGGRRLIVAFVDEAGVVARYRNDRWDHERIELAPGERVLDVAVTGTGDVVIALTTRLWVWDREERHTVRLPGDAPAAPRAATGSSGRQAFVVGEGGSAYEWRGSRLDPLVLPAAAGRFAGAPWLAAWYSAATSRLWVRVGRDGLLCADLEHGDLSTLAVPQLGRESGAAEAGEHARIDGVVALEGDVVVLSMGREVYAFSSNEFRLLGTVDAPIDDLVVLADRDVVAVASGGVISEHPLGRSAADAPGAPDPLTSGEIERLRWDRWRRRMTVQQSQLRTLAIPTIQISQGAVGHFGMPRPVSYGLDVGIGALFSPNLARIEPSWWLWPRLDYSFDSHPRRGGHGATLGLGVGVGTDVIAGFYSPRVWAGSAGGDPFIGLRHGMGVHALWGVFGLEVQHGLRSRERALEHELRGVLTINLAPLIWIASISARYNQR